VGPASDHRTLKRRSAARIEAKAYGFRGVGPNRALVECLLVGALLSGYNTINPRREPPAQTFVVKL
jgi:hypothetical protein